MTTMPPATRTAPTKARTVISAKEAQSPKKKAAASAKKAMAPAKVVPARVGRVAAPAGKPPARRKAVPIKPVSAPTITLKQIAAEIAEGHDLAKKQAEALLGGLVAVATRHLTNGDKIRLTGLGMLQVQVRAARMGRNPATGEAIQIKASKKIAFRPSKELKEAV
jgi:DNA-binding protein HU-beta